MLKDEITLCKKGNNELMEGIITGGAPNMIVQLKEIQNALQQQMELFSRMIVAQSENLALFHQKQCSTQLLENAPARNVQDDMDGSEELECLTPVTLPRFKRVQRKIGYMKDLHNWEEKLIKKTHQEKTWVMF